MGVTQAIQLGLAGLLEQGVTVGAAVMAAGMKRTAARLALWPREGRMRDLFWFDGV